MKLGLNWDKEKHPETIVEKCLNNLIYLNKLEEIKGDGSDHILINGDNFAGLNALRPAFKEKVDVIVIDPPYNTGGDFMYNDKYVDATDDFRSSKWLNIMEKRLRLAKDLLKDDGIIYCFIGDDELFHLGDLMDEIFGRENRITVMSRITKKNAGRGKNIGNCADFILAYSKTVDGVQLTKIEAENRVAYDQDVLMRASAVAPGTISDSSTFPVYIPELDITVKPKDGRWWFWGQENFDKLLAEDKIIWTKANRSYGIVDLDGNDVNVKGHVSVVPSSQMKVPNFIDSFPNSQGTIELGKLFPDEVIFNYPKPTGLIEYLINLTNKPNDITVLDFFAGSGTTAHAVIKMNENEKTKGTRKSISIGIDSELDRRPICTEVTFERIKKVINNNNLKYFKVDFVPRISDAQEEEIEEYNKNILL